VVRTASTAKAAARTVAAAYTIIYWVSAGIADQNIERERQNAENQNFTDEVDAIGVGEQRNANQRRNANQQQDGSEIERHAATRFPNMPNGRNASSKAIGPNTTK
jgi:hypothetical protein